MGENLADDLQEILTFLNNNPNKVSFKDISRQFSITKTTTRKRIKSLAEHGLVTISKNGRSKIIRSTEIGKCII